MNITASGSRWILCVIKFFSNHLSLKRKLPGCRASELKAPAGKRIFITGGTGFLGSHLLQSLKGSSVTVLSRDPEAFIKRRPELQWDTLSFIKGDIQSFTLNPDASFDYVIHGGTPSDSPSDHRSALALWRTALIGTHQLLNQLDRLKERPKKILYLSSGAVYGPQPADLRAFPESFVRHQELGPSIYSPSGAYGESKLATERLLSHYAGSTHTPLTVARIFGCAGPYLPLRGRFALGQFIQSAIEHQEIRIASDGTTKRSYLAGNELAEWLLTLLVSGTGTEIYNLGSDDAISIRQVAEEVQAVFKRRQKEVRIIHEPLSDKTKGRSPDYIPDLTLITEKHGLRPLKSSIQSVQETTEWVLDEA